MRVLPAAASITRVAVKTSSLSPPSQAPTAIEFVDEVISFRPLLRRLLWFTILLLVAFNAVLLGVLAYCYQQNEKNDSLLWLFRIYFLYSNGNAFLMQNSKRVALGYAVLCGVFGLVGLRLAWTILSRGHSRTARISRAVSSTKAQSAMALAASVLQRPKHWYSRWHQAFGVRGPYFDIRLLVEEVFEIGGQTAAAFSASKSISNVPLNTVYAAVIFFNSVSAFTFRRLFKASLIKQRLACEMVDLVLDFVWGSLLPIWMYVPIVRIYLDRARVLDYIATFTNSTREIERVLIISWKLYALSVIPFVNSLVNFLELQSIMHEISQLAGGAMVDSFGWPTRWSLPLYGIAVLVVSLSANVVGDHWSGLLYFDCMACGLEAIPEAVYHMPRLTMLSFALSAITSVPENWVPRSHLQLQTIWFDYNLQLAELPDSLWRQVATCGSFSMSWTNLSAVPDWVADIAGPDFLLTAVDTPVCTGSVVLAPKVKQLVICERYLSR